MSGIEVGGLDGGKGKEADSHLRAPGRSTALRSPGSQPKDIAVRLLVSRTIKE